MSNQGHGLLRYFYIGFVCFVLILAQISGEHLKDGLSMNAPLILTNSLILAQFS